MHALEYPDLDPPPGWAYAQVGSQIRLLPPGQAGDAAEAAIIVAPLLARHPGLPALEAMLDQALATEADSGAFSPTPAATPASAAAAPVELPSGLRGVQRTVQGTGPDGAEGRLYLLLSDDRCCYGLSYVARQAAFERHLPTFWATARSLRPFRGRPLAPPAPVGASPVGNYED